MGKTQPKKRAVTAGGSRKKPVSTLRLLVAAGVLVAVAVVAIAIVWGGPAIGRRNAQQSATAIVEAKADSRPRISLSPTTVDLGKIGQSRSVAGTITVWNMGTAELLIKNVETS